MDIDILIHAAYRLERWHLGLMCIYIFNLYMHIYAHIYGQIDIDGYMNLDMYPSISIYNDIYNEAYRL